MRPGQSGRWRLAILVAVVGLHFLAGLLVLATGSIRIQRLRAAAPLSLLWLTPESPPQRPAASAESTPEHNLKKRETSRDIDRRPLVEPEPSNAITLPLDLKR